MKTCICLLVFLSLFMLQAFTFPQESGNDSVNYQIRLKGISSGKEKTFTGRPNELFTIWKHLEDSIKGFNPSEQVIIEANFIGTNAVLKDTLPLSKLKKFPNFHLQLLSDCEMFNYDQMYWSSPFTNQSVINSEIDTKHHAPQGKGCLKMEGTDTNEDGYICSLTRYFQRSYAEASTSVPFKSSTADNTWIFFYAYGEGRPNDVVSLLVSETDIIVDNRNTKDYYSYNIPLDFYGWKQFAIRYSDLKSTVPTFINNPQQKLGQQGDKIHDPKKLSDIQFRLETKVKGSKATCYLDNLMIIYN